VIDQRDTVKIIDYGCDNEKKFYVGAPSWYHCVDEDSSRIPKMPVINPLQALVNPQTQKNYPAWIANPNPNFSEFAIFCQ
jgi:hypothetical protein